MRKQMSFASISLYNTDSICWTIIFYANITCKHTTRSGGISIDMKSSLSQAKYKQSEQKIYSSVETGW